MRAVAQRYARALADVVIEKGSAEAVRVELSEFAQVVDESADLRNFLANPAVTRPHKQAVVEKLVARLDGSMTLRNFLLVLVENRRAALVKQIGEAFEAELRARLGVAKAEVTSARELSGEERNELVRTLERLTGKRVEASYTLNPELIAGAQVRIGSTVYDGSVREQLNRMRTRLTSE
ncbi:MAG: ATP synthase F1 subunit delta [Acidobacteria bacterium]|nr:ATP synthase F1 subunit delta [Acidobacteriota bacterium]MBI3662101.1 ATP synthase F1 subunit delta [Acidobacteriota bacterium]